MRYGATLCALLALTPKAAQSQRSWRIENFDVELEVQADGKLLVTERIQPRFVGSFNGIFRSIPLIYSAPGGFSYKLMLRLLSVTDEEANKLRCETSRDKGAIKYKIWIPGARDTTKTVVLRYRVDNGLRFFPDHDELYWNVTGAEWPVPIDHASAVVKLPPAAAGPGLRATAYTGPYGSVESDAEIETRGSEVSLRTRHGLSYKEGLTVVVGWDKGVVAEPSRLRRAGWFLRGNWGFGLPILVFLVMFRQWYRRGKDPRPDVARMVRYEPPERLTPGEAGTLVDNQPDTRDITATLVDLAVRGYVRIEEIQRETLLWAKRDYVLHLLKAPGDGPELKQHERRLLEGVFGRSAVAGKSVKLSDLENEFYKELPAIRKALFNELVAQGYYARSPEKVKGFYIGLGIIVVVAATTLLMLAATRTGSSPLSAIVGGPLSGAVILIFGWFMPARTLRGAYTRCAVLGFEEFLDRAEKDHIARLQGHPELFDKFLPYAMALGVERKWTRAFEGIYREPPEWYRGQYGSGFRPLMLIQSLNSFTRQAGSTFTSSPRSSSGGSGFGGGGFSGGGFGGGGGGAF